MNLNLIGRFIRPAALFVLVILGSSAVVSAQAPVDVTRLKANPETKIFSDGKTSVADHLVAVVKNQTTCCGSDDVYLEVKVNPRGFVTSVRAMSGKNESLKRSLQDVVKYIRWDVEGKPQSKPIYFPVKFNATCKGKDDNKYVPVPKPAGWTFGEEVHSENPGLATTQTPPSTGNNTAPATLPEGLLIEPASASVVANDTNVQKLVLPAKLADPKIKLYGNEKKPDASHDKTHLNTQGPVMTRPTYAGTESELMIFVKSSLRKAGVCGLAHSLAELTIDGAGEVKNIRVLQVNNDQVHQNVLPLFAKLKFNPTGTRYNQYFLMEFKTDIDCPNRREVNLQQVGKYFIPSNRGPRY